MDSEHDRAALIQETEACMDLHCRALLDLGMIVNQDKTESVAFTRNNPERITLQCGSNNIATGEGIKVLGVYFDEKLTWKNHIRNTINKMNRLTNALKFLRKRLTCEQFLKATTSQFYGLCCYGSPLWLGAHTQVSQIRKLNSLHLPGPVQGRTG